MTQEQRSELKLLLQFTPFSVLVCLRLVPTGFGGPSVANRLRLGPGGQHVGSRGRRPATQKDLRQAAGAGRAWPRGWAPRAGLCRHPPSGRSPCHGQRAAHGEAWASCAASGAENPGPVHTRPGPPPHVASKKPKYLETLAEEKLRDHGRRKPASALSRRHIHLLA